MLDPPAPQVLGVLVPGDLSQDFDYARLIDPPGNDYNDLAFDCVTFPVPVVWVANHVACELIAYEVSTRGPCLQPGDRLLRGSNLTGRPLPVVTAAAEAIWRAPDPPTFRDEGFILGSPLTYYYRLLDPADGDRGDVLRAVKDTASPAVVVNW